MIEIIAIKIKDIKSLDDILLNFICEDKRIEFKKYKSHKAFQHALYSEIIKRYILEIKLNLKYDNTAFYKNKYDKPFIVNNPIYFNISHSKDWIVAAMNNKIIGIDVEYIKPINFSIAERYFSFEEYKKMANMNDNEKLEYFYDIWTLKESFIKTIGQGLSLSLDSFSIILDNDKNIKIKSKYKKKFFFKQYFIDKDYKLSVCATNNIYPDKIGIIDINYMLSIFS